MIVSIYGALVCAALLLLGRLMGSAIIIGLFASLAFGATSIATLTVVGGSSPQIYTMFVLMLMVSIVFHRGAVDELSKVFQGHWLPWLVLIVLVYAVGGALILPSLFAGNTTAFVPINLAIVEVPLGRVTGNFTQTAYFALGALTFYAFTVLLRKRNRLVVIRRGFMVYAGLLVVLGLTDLIAKLVGFADILAPIRTASYRMHAETAIGDFWRIAGGFSEASGFAAASVTCLAFVLVYWRATGSLLALGLGLCLLGLLLLSTSSTAYVALIVLALVLLGSLLRSFFVGRILVRDMALLFTAIAGVAALLAVYLGNEKLFDPFVDLFNSMVFEKLNTESAVERMYWNQKSLQALWDTGGLGVGMGSSRSSSLIVSILSQFGIIGAILFGGLIGFLLWGLGGRSPPQGYAEMFAIASSVRAAALGSLLAASISGASADPGLIFFISLAVLLSIREHIRTGQNRVGSRLASGPVILPRPPIAEACTS